MLQHQHMHAAHGLRVQGLGCFLEASDRLRLGLGLGFRAQGSGRKALQMIMGTRLRGRWDWPFSNKRTFGNPKPL